MIFLNVTIDKSVKVQVTLNKITVPCKTISETK